MGQGAYHWDRIYEARKTESVSWFQSDPTPSLSAIALCGGQALSIIDIGGGSSRLAGALVEQRRHDVTVLDLSKRVLTPCPVSGLVLTGAKWPGSQKMLPGGSPTGSGTSGTTGRCFAF